MMKAATLGVAVVLAIAGGAAMGQGVGDEIKAMGEMVEGGGPATTQAATQASGRVVAVAELQNPRSIAVDEAGTLYVVDVFGQRVQKFVPKR